MQMYAVRSTSRDAVELVCDDLTQRKIQSAVQFRMSGCNSESCLIMRCSTAPGYVVQRVVLRCGSWVCFAACRVSMWWSAVLRSAL